MPPKGMPPKKMPMKPMMPQKEMDTMMKKMNRKSYG